MHPAQIIIEIMIEVGHSFRGCVKSYFIYYQSHPEACMASTQSDFFNFVGLIAHPQQQAQIDKWMKPVRKITPHQTVATLFIDI